MRILYGVQTTGRGHLVRSAAMVRGLKERGHDVLTLFSGPEVEPALLDPIFRPHIERRGLTHVSVDGRISYVRTARQLRPWRFFRDVREFDARNIELVVSDYEPLSVRIARRNEIPSVGIGHLYAFAHDSVPVVRANLLNREILRRFAPADVPLGLHWHHFDRAILPPTIPSDVPAPAEASSDGPVLVYMSFESRDTLCRTLSEVKRHEFKVYSAIDAPERHRNVAVCPIDRRAFVADLLEAKGVLCNAGFSLISEALHLGKRVLAKPVRHQTEQESNAKALVSLGLGTAITTVDAAAIAAWLDGAEPIEPRGYPDVMRAVLDWIDEPEPRRPIADLAAQLWAACDTAPPPVTANPPARPRADRPDASAGRTHAA